MHVAIAAGILSHDALSLRLPGVVVELLAAVLAAGEGQRDVLLVLTERNSAPTDTIRPPRTALHGCAARWSRAISGPAPPSAPWRAPPPSLFALTALGPAPAPPRPPSPRCRGTPCAPAPHATRPTRPCLHVLRVARPLGEAHAAAARPCGLRTDAVRLPLQLQELLGRLGPGAWRRPCQRIDSNDWPKSMTKPHHRLILTSYIYRTHNLEHVIFHF